MKKLIGLVIGFTVAGALLTGCSSSKSTSGSASSSDSANGKIVLNMEWWGSAPRAEATTKAIKDFEKVHPNIVVQTSYEGNSAYWQKIPTELSGGNGPDVMLQDISYISGYARRGALLSLDKSIIDTSSIKPTVLSTGEIDGKLYGIPAGIEGAEITYNPALLQKADITIKPNEQITWTQYAQIANQVSNKFKGVYGTPDLSGNEGIFQYYLKEKGEAEYTSSGKLGFSKQSLVDWLNYWDALRQSGAAPKATFTASQANVVQDKSVFATGETPFTADFSGNSDFNDYETYLHEPLNMMMVPAVAGGKEGNYPRPTMYYSVNASSKYPKEAQELINFLTNNETAGKDLGIVRGVPASTKIADEVHQMLPSDQQTAWTAIQAELNVATQIFPLPPTAATQISKLFSNIVQENQYGKLTANQAAEQFISQASGILSSGN
jgi:multiple sugar transport system substrate-binding protein